MISETEEVVGAGGVLELERAGGRVYIHGMVEHVRDLASGPDGRRLEVILRSPLHRLVHTVQSRVFLGRRVDEIAEEVLRGGGFEAADFQLRLQGRYPAREYVVQYNESDYAFLLRQLTWWGLWWFFEQDESGARLVITDHNGAGGELAGGLVYHARSGTVRGRETVLRLGRRGRLLTEAVSLSDYNYRTPEAGLTAEARRACGPAGCGEARVWGSHHGDLDEGEQLVRLRREALDWRRETVVARTDSRGLAPGLRVSLSGHGGLDGDYLVVEVAHEAEQESARPRGPEQTGPTYENEAVLVRLEVPYRTPVEREDIQIPRPPASFTARVETTGGEYAHLDEEGRYRIRLPFDPSDTPAGQGSHPVRMMQPFVGARYGFHFPLRPGTEVLVGCINGDLDRPVILGAVHNAATPNPVTAANASQHILRTAAGHELLMEDRRGEERI
ncbi:MAG TPA: type VI secretion system tip protein VgrG, partial [Pyrodictium sp.]|nr:type VI secretion system tip protein VgrG [Pyrodictium sp.]